MCKVLQYFGKWCNYSAVTVKSLNSYRMIMNCTKGDIPLSDNKSKMPGILARLRMVVGLNIGTIMFGILFIYMAFSAILYFTTTHIESYQVTSGPLSRNETYTGLAIREESLCKADSSGYITYYAREGSKINASGAVYGLSDTKTASAPASLAPEELSKVRTDMMSFPKDSVQVNLTAPTALNMN